MLTDGRPAWEVRAYPHDDAIFLADAQAAVAASWETVHRGRRLLDEVRSKLRARYPDCDVRLQDDLARFGLDATVIYAFRDGKAA
jgi:hypothetical protein